MLEPMQRTDAGHLVDLFRAAFTGCQVAPGESVAVVSGAHSPQAYVDASWAAATALGAVPFGVHLPSIRRPASLVPGCGEIYGATGLSDLRPAVEALKHADIVIDLVVLLHSAEQEEILSAGTRILMITEPPEILERMFPTDDLRRRAQRSGELLRSAKRLRVRSDAGTDLTAAIGDFGAGGSWGFTNGSGTHAHWPSGMAATYPNEGTASGTWVIDVGDIIFPFKTYVQNPIVITVDKGFITDISGHGPDAALYRDYLEIWDDPEGYALSHMGWGLNDRALWNALAVFDRAATQGMDGRCFAGNILLSTGPNNEAGGSRFTLAHSDVPMRNCSLWLDDRQILDHGHFVAEDLELAPRRHALTSPTVGVRS